MEAKRARKPSYVIPVYTEAPNMDVVVDYLWKVADTYAEESTHKRVWNLAPVSDEEPPF